MLNPAIRNEIDAAKKTGKKDLDLSQYGLKSIPVEINAIAHLEKINLSGNPISDLSALKVFCQSLKYLDLSYTQVSSESIEGLAEFERLEVLDLAGTLVKNLSAVNLLENLKIIDVSYTAFHDLRQIKNLIVDNELILIDGERTIQEGIYCKDCELYPISQDDIKQSKYLKILLFRTDEIVKVEVKQIFIIGQAQTGKTTLYEKLQKVEFNVNSKTRIQYIYVKDFCRRFIQSEIYKFFISDESLYLMIDTDRNNRSVNSNHLPFRYWIPTLKLNAQNSGLIVIINKIDQRGKYLDKKEIINKFGKEVRFFQMNFLKDELGENIVEAIKENINDSPESYIPQHWLKCSDELIKLVEGKNVINRADFDNLCKIIGVSGGEFEDENENFLRFLSKIGIVRFFNDEELENLIIVNDEWLADAVEELLYNKYDKKEKGIIQNKFLRKIWGDKKFSDKIPELKRLVRKYNIAFSIKLKNETFWVIPNRIPFGQNEWGQIQHNLSVLSVKYVLKEEFYDFLNRILDKVSFYIAGIEDIKRQELRLHRGDSTAII